MRLVCTYSLKEGTGGGSSAGRVGGLGPVCTVSASQDSRDGVKCSDESDHVAAFML